MSCLIRLNKGYCKPVLGGFFCKKSEQTNKNLKKDKIFALLILINEQIFPFSQTDTLCYHQSMKTR